jgi:hypothetical protein
LLSGHPAGRGDQKIPVSDILAVNVTADGFPASVFLPAPLPQGIVAQRVPEGMEIQDRNVFIISRTVIGGSVRKTDRRCYVQPTDVKTIEKKPLPPGFFTRPHPAPKSRTAAVLRQISFWRAIHVRCKGT